MTCDKALWRYRIVIDVFSLLSEKENGQSTSRPGGSGGLAVRDCDETRSESFRIKLLKLE